jgi:hypothetical protein
MVLLQAAESQAAEAAAGAASACEERDAFAAERDQLQALLAQVRPHPLPCVHPPHTTHH